MSPEVAIMTSHVGQILVLGFGIGLRVSVGGRNRWSKIIGRKILVNPL